MDFGWRLCFVLLQSPVLVAAARQEVGLGVAELQH